MAFKHILKEILLLVMLLGGLASCESEIQEESNCAECPVVNFAESLSNIELKVNSFGYSLGSEKFFRACKSSSDFEMTKILSVKSARVYKTCEGANDAYISLDEYEVLETCLPEIDSLEGAQSFSGKWSFYEIIDNSDSLLLPCELMGASIQVTLDSEKKTYSLDASFGENGAYHKGKLLNDTLFLEEALFTLAIAPTATGRAFEGAYLNVMGSEPGQVITYELYQNWMVLRTENGQVKCYRKE